VALTTHFDLVPRPRRVELFINSPKQCPDRLGTLHNFLSPGTGALPKGIKRKKQGTDQSNQRSAEVKNSRAIYLHSPSGHTGSGANTNTYPIEPGHPLRG
jgi:hypothetical protein